jgi:hypothetical protein
MTGSEQDGWTLIDVRAARHVRVVPCDGCSALIVETAKEKHAEVCPGECSARE